MPHFVTADTVKAMSETRSAHVTLTAENHWKTEIQVGPHKFISDAPAASGGQDLAPDPEEFLLSAWGACTAMTVQMYAQRKGWPLERVEVVLDRIPRSAGTPEKLVRKVAFFGPLDAEQRDRLKDIAEKCPVHRTLSHAPTIETKIAEVTP